MSRRRLRVIHYSSSSEEEQQQEEEDHRQQQTTNSTETLISPNPNPNHTTPQPRPLEISDDDFLDVAEDLSPPSPPPSIPASRPSSTFSSTSSFNFSIHQHLENLGLKLRRDWLDSCISTLNTSIAGFSSLDVSGKAQLCFAQFLYSDMNVCGAGVLPQNVHNMHLVDLPGPFVLQVDEIVNICRPLKDRYQEASAGSKRCLKLSMTDGVQRVYGMEYRPIKNIQVLAPAGFKVCISKVHVRRGLLLLVPEVLDILGGCVQSLDAARQRLVNEVNKPPRGKRTRTESAPSLSSRATRAAWPPNNVDVHQNIHDHGNNVSDNGLASTSTSQHRGPDRGNNVNNGPAITSTLQHRGPDRGNNVNNRPASTSTSQNRGPDHGNNVNANGHSRTSTSQHRGPGCGNNVNSNGGPVRSSTFQHRGPDRGNNVHDNGSASTATSQHRGPGRMSDQDPEDTDMIDASVASNRNARGRVTEVFADTRVGSSSEPYASRNANLDVGYTIPRGRFDATFGVDARGRVTEDLVPVVSSSPSNAVVNLHEINMLDSRMHSHGNIRGRDAEALASPSFMPNSKPNIHLNAALDVGDTDSRGRVDAMLVTTGVGTREGIAGDPSVRNSRSNVELNPSSDAVMNLEEVNMNDVSMPNHENSGARDFRVDAAFGTSRADHVGRTSQNFSDPNAAPNSSSNAIADLEVISMIDASMPIHGDDRKRVANFFEGSSVRPGPSSEAAVNIRDTDMHGEVEDPLILNGDDEAPFTYLTSLFANWTAEEDEGTPRVVGKIKCFLTGVKDFKFKGRSTYELHVFVDDGSLISEILINHDVVEKAIGHSPKEVTAALSSPDSKVSTAMKEIMRRFQLFLINFEGIMLVEISNESPLPIAIEMNQGCSSSDAWLLLRRTKRLNSPQTPQRQKPEIVEPIDISP